MHADQMPLGWTYSSNPSATTLLLSDSARIQAGTFYVPPKTVSPITKVGFRISAIGGTGGTYKFGLQSVAADGTPSGTWLNDGGGEASVIAAPGSAAFNMYTLTNDYQPTAGELIAAVMAPQTNDGTNNATVFRQQSAVIQQGLYFRNWYIQTSAWVSGSHACVAAESADGSIWGLPILNFTNLATFTNASSPNEYGMKFTMPTDFAAYELFGITYMPSAFTSGGTHTLSLYSGGGAADTTVLASVSRDLDSMAALNNSNVVVMFNDSSPVELVGGDTYRLSLRPDSTQSIGLYYQEVSTAAHFGNSPFGTNSCYTTRAGGNWTDTTTRKFPWALIIGARTPNAGGGGSKYFHSCL